jgi:hypothetical protein
MIAAIPFQLAIMQLAGCREYRTRSLTKMPPEIRTAERMHVATCKVNQKAHYNTIKTHYEIGKT